MSLVVDLSIPAQDFKLGQILQMERGTRIVIETTVPLGDKLVPFIRVFDEHDRFETTVSNHSDVTDIHVVSTHDGEILYALDWTDSQDQFFQGIKRHDGTIMKSAGSENVWNFELRFESHDALSNFQEYCQSVGMGIEINRLYNPTKPDAGPWFGLTPPQRNALKRAVEAGYYNIPREISTQNLADEFEITDQAMTERLRRAIGNLVSNTLQVSDEQADA